MWRKSLLAAEGMRINSLSPGVIDTPVFGRPQGLSREAIEGFKAIVPMGRVGEADEIAKAALFLISDDASYVTGADPAVDGGAAQV